MTALDICLLSCLIAQQATKEAPTLTIHTDQRMAPIAKTLYGIFFEEINCAGDGGIYAEQIRNRSFEDSKTPEHWEIAGSPEPLKSVGISSEKPLANGSPSWLRLGLKPGAASQIQLTNRGYWGINAQRGQKLSLSLAAKTNAPTKITVELLDERESVIATSGFAPSAHDWQKLTATLSPTESSTKASLRITVESESEVGLDHISLIPTNESLTGFRGDLAKMLADLRPSFMRFPGGCWVEGDTMATAMRWKQTIGPVESRRTLPNLWGYHSTNGLGFHEYLLLCEQIGAEPLFVINCGMSHREVVPIGEMDEFVQDALDAIEYANEPATSKWGSVRAAAGHPNPFNLRFMEIGNENGGPAYEARYALFYKAIKTKYPNVNLIANVWGGHPKDTPVEILDEHYYSNPEFFFQNANRYDSYDRTGPKIYVGEYAVTQGCGNGNLIAALAEAAFMTGMERNSDVVTMSSYAPLFANVNKKAWNPDLIYFDNNRAIGTPSYYVQKLFSENRPDLNLGFELQNQPAKTHPFPDGGIGVGSWNTQVEYRDLKVRDKDGNVIIASADGSSLVSKSGTWRKTDQLIQQSGSDTPAVAVQDARLTDFEFALKARKLSGAEGFLILVGYQNSDNYLWLNLGGWGNSLHAIEFARNGGKSLVGKQIPGKIETGKWYEIRIAYSHDRIECYLDGKRLFSEAAPSSKSLYTAAGKMQKTGEIIVKVVNSESEPAQVKIALEGSNTSRYKMSETWLSSASATDENSLDFPNKVAPKTVGNAIVNRNFTYLAKPLSLTILRFTPEKPIQEAKR